MISATITSKGQTTLPKAVRLALGVGAGDRVCFVVQDNEVRLLPMRPIGRLFGVLKHHGPPMSLEDMERGIAEGACEDAAAATADSHPNALPRRSTTGDASAPRQARVIADARSAGKEAVEE